MKPSDLHNLIRWTVDTSGVQFAKEIYNREEPDEYTRGKFWDMQNRLINWIAELDNRNRERLARAINNQEERWTEYRKKYNLPPYDLKHPLQKGEKNENK